MATVPESDVVFQLGWFDELNDARECKRLYCFLFDEKGNSNGLSTIDVSTGFVGLQGSNELLTGSLIFLSIYGLSMNWLRAIENNRLMVDCLKDQFLMNSIYLISMTIQRQHLFLWTVFAPKLIYLFCQTSSLMFVYLSKIVSADE